MSNLPSGTVTFLFTDIEGSTRLLQQQGQRYAGLLQAYRELLRSIVQTHSGQEVDTQGDSFLVAFGRAVDAVAAAVAIQRALASYSWPEGVYMATRIGVHTGEPQLQPGGYVGLDVHRAARLMAAGHGGQVLLSQATYGLVLHELPEGVQLRDLGEHRLKDLLHPERISQLVIPDLQAAFPPLRTLDPHRTNLPAQPTPLIGREREIAQVTALLRRDDVRLVTLTGPGGTGKTRLGLQVAAELLDDFADGIYVVNLAPINDSSLVASTVAQALGAREAAGRSPQERVTEYLRDKCLLLLVDNFEQVLDADLFVADLLGACPHLKILVTSRAVLHLRGEKEFPVPPLALPPNRLLSHAGERGLEGEGELTQYAAVRLFIVRAQDARPDFAVTSANAATITEICERLDGLPLAIELAAARSKLFAPEALLARLSNRLALLTGGARDLPARQQTLRSTIDWSHNLLNPDEQALFRRLGVFVGGCTIEAAEAVCGGVGSWELGDGSALPSPNSQLPTPILDGLASLLDQSLVRQAEGQDGGPRFTMLETIHEYALERLAEAEEMTETRRRHAEYFVALAERADTVFEGPHLIEWIEPLATNYLNLRAALVFTLGVPELPIGGDAEISITGGRSPPAAPGVPPALRVSLVETGVRLAAALGSFWWIRSMYREGRAWLRHALRQPDAPAASLARATFHAGVLAHLQDDNNEAEALFAECRDRFRALGDPVGESFTCIWQGIVARKHLQAERALALAVEALASFEALSHRNGEARARFLLGLVALDQGDFALAERDIGMAVTLLDAHDTSWGAGWFHLNLGHAARFRGDEAAAMVHYRECLRIFELAHDLSGLALTHLCLHHMARARGEWLVAWEGYLACFAQCREQGNRRQAAECLEGLAALLQVAGRPEMAARLLGAAERTRELIAIPLTAGERQDYAHTLAAIRSQRDEATIAAAWAAGRAMTLEQAIAEALDEAPEPGI